MLFHLLLLSGTLKILPVGKRREQQLFAAPHLVCCRAEGCLLEQLCPLELLVLPCLAKSIVLGLMQCHLKARLYTVE